MRSTTALDLSQWIRDWGNLSLSAVLVIITGAGAWLTWRLAQSAKDSTMHAREAARAASESVAAMQATVPISFTVEPVFDMDEEMRFRTALAGVRVRSAGATLWIWEVAVIEHSYRLSDEVSVSGVLLGPARLEPPASASGPWEGVVAVPQLLHQGGSVYALLERPDDWDGMAQLDRPTALRRTVFDCELASLLVEVTYSVTRESGQRKVIVGEQ